MYWLLRRPLTSSWDTHAAPYSSTTATAYSRVNAELGIQRGALGLCGSARGGTHAPRKIHTRKSSLNTPTPTLTRFLNVKPFGPRFRLFGRLAK